MEVEIRFGMRDHRIVGSFGVMGEKPENVFGFI